MMQHVTLDAPTATVTVTVTVTRDADGSRRVRLAGSHFRRTNPAVTLQPSVVRPVLAEATLRHSRGGGAHQVWGLTASRVGRGRDTVCSPQFGRLDAAVEAAAAAMMTAATRVPHYPV